MESIHFIALPYELMDSTIVYSLPQRITFRLIIISYAINNNPWPKILAEI